MGKGLLKAFYEGIDLTGFEIAGIELPLTSRLFNEDGQPMDMTVGKSGERYLGNAYRYIERYAEQIQMSPHMACLKAMGETEKVLNLILAKNDPSPMEIQAEQTIAA